MDANFWHLRWENSEIGFHRDDAHPFLRQFWSDLSLPHGSRVLVPLCGKSLDLLWLRATGYRVVGVELSQLAVEQFFGEADLVADVREQGGLHCWHADGIEIWCGDFFALTQTMLGEVDGLYDRAALIALPSAMRGQYVEQLSLLAPATPGLLITLEYDQQRADGPPFSVEQDEVIQRYDQRFAVRPLHAEITDDVPPKFRQQGVVTMTERVYRLG